MKNNSSLRRRACCDLLLPFALFTFIATIPELHAQCAGGAEPDALGCAVPLSSPAATNQSSASINIQESLAGPSPKADNSTEASAIGSLPGGTDHTESGVGESRVGRPTQPSPTEPLSEFQRFVSASTGLTPPVYGAKLFSSQPASFGPLDHGPAPGELIIGNDDELRVRLWGQVNFSANLRVSREGEIYFPKVGAIHVAGLAFSAVPAHLRSVIERVYHNFDMSVDLGEIHSIQIYVTGLAHRPGEYTISALSTLVDAVFASGGPSVSGSMRHVLLKRSGKVIADFDLYALLIDGDKAGDLQLQPGDVLQFPPVGPQVALIGSVREPSIYELRGKESIQDVIDAAGGTTTIASGAHVSLERIEEHARRRAFEVATDMAGLATLVDDGDIVRVDPIPSLFHEAVTLRGAVANPGHFRWHEGMRLSELMPDRDSLVKRDYWWHRTQLGLPIPELVPPGGGSGLAELAAIVESPADQTNWNYAVIERLAPSTMTTSLIPFNLGKLVLDHDTSQDLTLLPGDVISIFSQSDIEIPINEQTRYVRLEGELVHPGVYSIAPGDTLRSVIERAGGFTPQAYLYGATFTRKSTRALEQSRLGEFVRQLEVQLARSSMNLVGILNSPSSGQAISINRELIERFRGIQATGRIALNMQSGSAGSYEMPDMHLEDGDRLVVPFTPETVQVLGAVFNPHAFLFHDNAQVGEYLHLAGGPNREADRKRIYVLRADGTVTSRDSDSGLFSRGFNSLRLRPGDSIIVPERDVHLSAMSKALAWAQAVSQSTMTALEVNALK